MIPSKTLVMISSILSLLATMADVAYSDESRFTSECKALAQEIDQFPDNPKAATPFRGREINSYLYEDIYKIYEEFRSCLSNAGMSSNEQSKKMIWISNLALKELAVPCLPDICLGDPLILPEPKYNWELVNISDVKKVIKDKGISESQLIESVGQYYKTDNKTALSLAPYFLTGTMDNSFIDLLKNPNDDFCETTSFRGTFKSDGGNKTLVTASAIAVMAKDDGHILGSGLFVGSILRCFSGAKPDEAREAVQKLFPKLKSKNSYDSVSFISSQDSCGGSPAIELKYDSSRFYEEKQALRNITGCKASVNIN